MNTSRFLAIGLFGLKISLCFDNNVFIHHQHVFQKSSIIGWFCMQRMMKSFVLMRSWNRLRKNGATLMHFQCVGRLQPKASRKFSDQSFHIIFLEKLSLTFEFSLLTFEIHSAGNSLNMHPIRYECEFANLCKYPLIAYKRFHLHLNCIIFCYRLELQSNAQMIMSSCWCMHHCILCDDATMKNHGMRVAYSKKANYFGYTQSANPMKKPLMFILIRWSVWDGIHWVHRPIYFTQFIIRFYARTSFYIRIEVIWDSNHHYQDCA